MLCVLIRIASARLAEAILMSTHNIGFYEDLTKIIFELSSNIIKYAPNISSSVLVILDYSAYLLFGGVFLFRGVFILQSVKHVF